MLRVIKASADPLHDLSHATAAQVLVVVPVVVVVVVVVSFPARATNTLVLNMLGGSP